LTVPRYAPDPAPPGSDIASIIADMVRGATTRDRARREWLRLAREIGLSVDPGVLAKRSSQGRTNAATDRAREARRRHTNPTTRVDGGPT
jgi:hypothetical protein